MSLEELYREVILDHYRSPRHRAEIEAPDATAEGVNPLCGDEVVVELTFVDDVVDEVSVRGHGCSISQSSGSMMSAAIVGKTLAEVEELGARFREMLVGEDEPKVDDLGDLAALQGVRRYPVRVKCATLPWATLDQALTSNGDGRISVA